MITSAAVIFKLKSGRQITMPVHRHGDAYQIMRDLGFQPEDYATMSQGFIVSQQDPEDPFNFTYEYLNRREARLHAILCGQVLKEDLMSNEELYSEDLW